MDLTQAIDEIISKKFNEDDYFDSHTVLDIILANGNYHEAYLKEYAQKF